MNEQKRIRVRELHYHIYQIMKNLRDVYSITKFLNISDNNNESNKKEKESFTSKINHYLKILQEYLIKINNINNILICDCSIIAYNNNINNNIKFYHNFYNIIIQNLTTFSKKRLIKELIKSDRNIKEIKNKNFRILFEKMDETKTITEYIYEFLKNDFKDVSNRSNTNNVNEINKEIQNEDIFFTCKLGDGRQNRGDNIANISINFFIFNISIIMPYNKPCNLMFFLEKITLLIEYKYDLSYTKINEGPGLIMKYTNYILIKKIQQLFESRIYEILLDIFEDTKYIKNRNFLFENDLLIELCKRFLYYINDYRQIFKTKCGVCEKIIKYSLNEKCFFPPYYKIYRSRDIKKNKEDNIKLFYHEECYKKFISQSL